MKRALCLLLAIPVLLAALASCSVPETTGDTLFDRTAITGIRGTTQDAGLVKVIDFSAEEREKLLDQLEGLELKPSGVKSGESTDTWYYSYVISYEDGSTDRIYFPSNNLAVINSELYWTNHYKPEDFLPYFDNAASLSDFYSEESHFFDPTPYRVERTGFANVRVLLSPGSEADLPEKESRELLDLLDSLEMKAIIEENVFYGNVYSFDLCYEDGSKHNVQLLSKDGVAAVDGQLYFSSRVRSDDFQPYRDRAIEIAEAK